MPLSFGTKLSTLFKPSLLGLFREKLIKFYTPWKLPQETFISQYKMDIYLSYHWSFIDSWFMYHYSYPIFILSNHSPYLHAIDKNLLFVRNMIKSTNIICYSTWFVILPPNGKGHYPQRSALFIDLPIIPLRSHCWIGLTRNCSRPLNINGNLVTTFNWVGLVLWT